MSGNRTSPFRIKPEPKRHKQRLVNQRFSHHRLWASLALVGSNFLGNSWVKSGWPLAHYDRIRGAIHYPESRVSASAFSTRYIMPMSRYIVRRGGQVLPRQLDFARALADRAKAEVAVGYDRGVPMSSRRFR